MKKSITKSTNIAAALGEAALSQKKSNLLYDAAMMSIVNDAMTGQKSKPINKNTYFKCPQVMGMDGHVTTADKVRDSVMQSGMMLDSSPICNIGGGLGTFNEFYFNQINTLLIDNVFLGYAEYSLLAQNGLLYNMCNTPATEMTREWIEFTSTGDDDKTDKILELEKEFERLNVKSIFQRAAFFMFSQGGILLYPKIKGDELDQELQQELYIDNMKIGKGDLEYITLIEPIWYVPIRYVTDNPLSKWFYVPEYWTCMGKIIHSSRVMQFIYNEVPNIIKPQYNFNGDPILGMAIPWVMPVETLRNTIVEIVERLNLTVFKTGLQAIVTGVQQKNPDNNSNAGANLGSRIRALTATRNNLGVLAIDKDNEEIENIVMSLTGLDEIFSRYVDMMCVIPQIPASIFLGTTPRGLNASSEYEIKKWHKHVRSLQEQTFRPHLIKLMKMAQLNIWGYIDEDITFEFKTLDDANDVEDSTIRLNTMTESTGYVAAGIITPEEIRNRLQSEEDSGWNTLETLEESEENEEPQYLPETENLSGTSRGATSNKPIGVAASYTNENPPTQGIPKNSSTAV